MSIQIIKGNLLESDVNYICHQVNCQGKMNSGIAKSIREKWPKAYDEYINWYQEWQVKEAELSSFECSPSASEMMLGEICLVNIAENKNIIHMASQEFYGYDKRRYTSYDAFWNCLHEIKQEIPRGSKIGFPYGIGCVRGGANWNIIYTMIKEVLAQNFEVYIYKLED